MLTGVRLILAALVLGVTSTAAVAQEQEQAEKQGGLLPWGLSANLAVTNDYVFRGFTQTQEDVAVQGGLDWDSGHGFYLGTWASNVKFGIPGEGDVEWDIYGGYKGAIGKFTYDVGAIGYLYPGANTALSYNWWEAQAKIGYDFDIATVSAGIAYTPDFFGGLDDGWYYSGKVLVPFAIEGLSADATIGLQDLKAPFDDVIDYSVGVTYAWKWFTTDLRYIDTDQDSGLCTAICDSRVVVKISRTF